MKKGYSKASDCAKLARYLKNKMGNSIEFDYAVYQFTVSGKYFHYHREPHNDLEHLFEDGIDFFYKYYDNDFLRISIGNSHKHECSLGEKLAALSSFYEVLKERFGEPTVFYTLEDDDKQSINLQWAFTNKEEEINDFKNGTYFDDKKVDKLIIIGEQNVNALGYQVGKTARINNSRIIGLPFDLFSLVE